MYAKPDNLRFSSKPFWDHYWQGDRLAACLPDYATGNYQNLVRGAWELFFAHCRSGARLLDIGTGNGAVPVIAFETAARIGKRLEIHGVDRADINPVRYVASARESLNHIQFHGKTMAETLPFPGAHFDLLTGQYALEYTDANKSVPELCRVAKPSARMRFVLHALDAEPVTTAAAGLSDIRYAMNNIGILDRARTMLRTASAFEGAEHYSATLDANAHAARETYRIGARVVDQRYTRSSDKGILGEILFGVRKVWDHRHEYGSDRALRCMDLIELEVLEHYARNADMCAAALSRRDAEQLAQRFHELSLKEVALNNFCGLNSSGSRVVLGWEITLH